MRCPLIPYDVRLRVCPRPRAQPLAPAGDVPGNLRRYVRRLSISLADGDLVLAYTVPALLRIYHGSWVLLSVRWRVFHRVR